MKKIIVAASLMALAAGAYAQSSVDIYGIVDVYAGYGSADGAVNRSAVNSGGLQTSRLGFRGTEKLDNGLSAFFTLEYGLDVSDNTSFTSARQQVVGLRSDTWGTVALGRQQTAGYDFGVKYDPSGPTVFSALGAIQRAGNFQISGFVNDVRVSNAVSYRTPEFNGFSGGVAYSASGEQTSGSTVDNSAEIVMANVNYNNGPLSAMVVYDRHTGKRGKDPLYAATNNTTDWAFGTSYDFKIAKVFGTYQTHENNALGKGGTDVAYQLGVSVPVSAKGKIYASYAAMDLDSAKNKNARAYNLAYQHDLSKRTALYAGYLRTNNDSNTTSAYGLNQPVTLGGSSNTLIAGMRHSF